MPEQPDTSSDIHGLVELLAGQIARLEYVTNETGASPIDTSASENVELALLVAVATLRRIRNAGRPVNKLPPEILSHIFYFVPLEPRAHGNLSREFGIDTVDSPVGSLLPLLCVCSRWRSIAATSSFLWSVIDNRDLLAPSISSKYRANSGPLYAHIDEYSFQPADFNFQRHPHAVRRFHKYNPALVNLLRNEGHRICRFFAEVSAVLVPVLTEFPGESLRVCELWLLENSLDEREEIRPLFNDLTPNLRSLIIGNLAFIPPNKFTSLTHLLLIGSADSTTPGSQFTFINFLLFLSHCHRLQVLYLHHLDVLSFHEVPFDDDPIRFNVNLPCLHKFSNEEVPIKHSGRAPYIGPKFRRALLRHLELSPDCVARLSTILPEDLGRSFRWLHFDKRYSFTSARLVGSVHGSQSSSNVTTDALDALEPEAFSIMATNLRQERGARVDFQMPGTRYAPENLDTTSARALIRDAFHGASVLSDVHELWVGPGANVLLLEPHSILAGFPSLTTLVLGLSPRASTPVLTNDREDGTAVSWDPLGALRMHDNAIAPPCPQLRILCVYGMAEQQVTLLRDMVSSRDKEGYTIQRLVVGFYEPPGRTVLDLVDELWKFVDTLTVIKRWEGCPHDLLWEDRLPSVCRDSSERNMYWPAWM